MTQYIAGYAAEIMQTLFGKQEEKYRLGEWLHARCFFDCEYLQNDAPVELTADYTKADASAVVLHNLLQRGMPTRLSHNAENYFLQAFANSVAALSDTRQRTVYKWSSDTSGIKQTIENGLQNNTWDNLQVAELALSPLAVGRLQRVLVECIANRHLNLEARTWTIGVVERDVPCAHIAITDFKAFMQHWLSIEGKGRVLPEIELSVYCNSQFKQSSLHTQFVLPANDLMYFDARKPFDLLLDIACMESLPDSVHETQARLTAVIRNAKQNTAPRRFVTGGLIEYTNASDKKALTYFANAFLRQTSLPEGTDSVINLMLRQQNCIGIIPDLYAQSLSWTVSTLLQPAITAVINPKDATTDHLQRFLLDNRIDAYADASLNEINELRQTVGGGALVAFITPEQLQAPPTQLGSILLTMPQRGAFFGYVVIPQANYLSEWNAVSPFSYFNVIRKTGIYCKTANTMRPVFAGFCMSASYNVVADIRRELQTPPTNVVRNTNVYDTLDYRIKPNSKENRRMYPKSSATPVSIEELLHEASLCAADNRDLMTILYDNEPVSFEEDYEEYEAWTARISRRKNQMPRDQYVGYTQLREMFRGRKKETAVVADIMAANTWSPGIKSDALASVVSEHFMIHLRFFAQPEKNPLELHVTTAGGKKVGHINYLNISINPSPDFGNNDLANEILQYTHELVIKHRPTDKNVFKWLAEVKQPDPTDGLDKVLKKTWVGESATVSIGFENDRLLRIADALHQLASPDFTFSIVNKAYYQASDASHFVELLSKTANLQIEIKGVNLANEIRDMYYGVRDRNATYLALMRLTAVGVIEDFVVNEYTRMFDVIVVRKKPELYLSKLYSLLQAYLSRERAQSVFTDIEKCPGNSIGEKCAYYWIDFVYDYIVPKRETDLRRIVQLCEIASVENMSENVKRQQVSEFLRRHFGAKFLLTSNTPNLVADTQQLTRFEWQQVESYTNQAADYFENVEHLRNSTAELLQSNPDNYVFLTLSAFAHLSLQADRDPDVEQGFEQLANGLLLMRKAETLTPEQVQQRAYSVCDKLDGLNEDFRDYTDPLLSLKMHNKWLQYFNRDFLKDYKAA